MPLSPAALDALVANRRRFLEFVTARGRTRADAEEILQDAFLRGLEPGDALRDDESAVAWFYRLLRNALVDHYRRRDAERRARERSPGGEVEEPGVDEAPRAAACYPCSTT